MSVAFFYEHGGFSWVPATQTKEQGMQESAQRLAAAEAFAREADWYFEWDLDAPGRMLDRPQGENGEPIGDECFYCQLLDKDGEMLECLCGIWDPSREYRRVVEAELALQAMAEKAGFHGTGFPGDILAGILSMSEEVKG